MIANEKGHLLRTHLDSVARMAVGMGRHIGVSEAILDIIYTSALLHDIGKVTESFQNYMTKCTGKGVLIDEDFHDPISEGLPLHHEIGWAFLTEKLGHDGILNAVYWHHARPIHDTKKKTYDDADEILNTLTNKDREALEGLWSELVGMINPNILGNLKRGTIEVPNLFEKDGSTNRNENAEFMLIRSCVIAADRYISSLPSIDLSDNHIKSVIDDMTCGRITGSISCPENYDADRFDMQMNIASDIGDERTSIIKAPAGLGKTMIGLIWSQLRDGKVLWVCPRNVVADSVYENILREIEVLGLSCTVELYRTGARQRTNFENDRPEFDSDIIVTNIDAVMSPMINNRIANRLFTVYGSHVVLDEFHEFISDAPLFAAFITYMRARHRIANNCKTLLLSATPSLVQVLWDTSDRKTLILPNESNHYPPQHKGVYNIGFSNGFPVKASFGDLLVCNSVSEAQKNYCDASYTMVIHHRYTENDREKKDQAIKNAFSKYKNGIKSESLSAALVVQAAMDISFLHLYDSVCSPESSLQRVGRTDRWGFYQNYSPAITFMDNSSKKTEGAAIRTVYNLDLQNKWYKFLKQSIGSNTVINLEVLYKIYNEFYKVYRTDLLKYIIEQYRVGMNGYCKGMEFLGLVSFNPVKVLNSDPDRKDNKQYKNLRNPDGSYFYTVELVGQPNIWLSPDDVLSEGYELHDRYESNGKLNSEILNTGAMLTRIKGLVACGYSAWTRYSKGKINLPSSLKAWFYKAKNPETPLPDFSRKYDSDLGVIKY